jgi:hypothetical protein
MAMKASHSTNINSLGHKEMRISVPMSAEDYQICTPLLQQLLHAKKIDLHLYDEATSTVHMSRSTKVAKEKRFGDVYLEKVLEIPMSGDDYETCTTGTGLLRQICFAGLIHSFTYEDETAAAYLYYKIRVEEGALRGKRENAQVEDLKRIQ